MVRVRGIEIDVLMEIVSHWSDIDWFVLYKIVLFFFFFFLMFRRPPRSTRSRSSAASDVYKGQVLA